MGQAWWVMVTGICGERWLSGGAGITAPKYSVSRAKTSLQRRVRLVLQKLGVRMVSTESCVRCPCAGPTAGTAAVGPISAVHVTLFQFIPPEPCEAGLTRPILQMKRQAQKFYPTQEHSMRMWLRQDLNPGPISLQNLCSFLCRALPFVSTIILLPTVPSYDPDG